MTREEVAQMIEAIGIPYAYYQFTEDTAAPPPFICYYYSEQTPFPADNINYIDIENLSIELYTSEKDFELEDSISNALTENEIPFTRYESYIDSEKLIMNTWESEVLING